MRFRNHFWKFWSGRNGADQLYQCMMWTCLGLLLLNMFLNSFVIYLLEIALLGWATYRAMSRNLYRRQQENQAFLRFFSRIGGWFKLCGNRWRDRKTHIYKKCPKCKNTLRLPKIKGSHTVCCPCCSNRFSIDV